MAPGIVRRIAALAASLLFAFTQAPEFSVHAHGAWERDLVAHDSIRVDAVGPCADGRHFDHATVEHHRACLACLASCAWQGVSSPPRATMAAPLPSSALVAIPRSNPLSPDPSTARGRSPPLA